MFRTIIVIKEIILEMMVEYYETLYKRCCDKAEKHRNKWSRYSAKAENMQRKLNKLTKEYQKVEGL